MSRYSVMEDLDKLRAQLAAAESRAEQAEKQRAEALRERNEAERERQEWIESARRTEARLAESRAIADGWEAKYVETKRELAEARTTLAEFKEMSVQSTLDIIKRQYFQMHEANQELSTTIVLLQFKLAEAEQRDAEARTLLERVNSILADMHADDESCAFDNRVESIGCLACIAQREIEFVSDYRLEAASKEEGKHE